MFLDPAGSYTPTTPTFTPTPAPTGGNLLPDGSFEGNDAVVHPHPGIATGWNTTTVVPDPGGQQPNVTFRGDEGVTDGASAAVFNDSETFANAVLYQTFTTVPGKMYTVGFDYGDALFGTTTNTSQTLLAQVFDGTGPVVNSAQAPLGQLTAIDTFGGAVGGGGEFLARQSFRFVATSVSSTIQFTDISGVISAATGCWTTSRSFRRRPPRRSRQWRRSCRWTPLPGATGSAPTAARAPTSPASPTRCPLPPSPRLRASRTPGLRRPPTSARPSTLPAPVASPPSGTAAPPFDFNLNLTDGTTHQVSLYLLDYDQQNRQESVQVLDANTHAVLAGKTVYPFTGGDYVVFDISGSVVLRISQVSGGGPVMTGLFLDQASDTFKGVDQDWADPNNWSFGSVPGPTDKVLIGSGFGTVDVTAGTYSAGSLTSLSPVEISAGARLSLNGAGTLNAGLAVDPGGLLKIATAFTATGKGPLVVTGLNISTGGVLDLGTSGMVVLGGQLSTVANGIAGGYVYGTWTGTASSVQLRKPTPRT